MSIKEKIDPSSFATAQRFSLSPPANALHACCIARYSVTNYPPIITLQPCVPAFKAHYIESQINLAHLQMCVTLRAVGPQA